MSNQTNGGVCSSPDSVSDEKMDTCESLNSQQRTPSSPLSSPLTDCEEQPDENREIANNQAVLRIAVPQSVTEDNRMDNAGVLRLAKPQYDQPTNTTTETTSETSKTSIVNQNTKAAVDSDNNRKASSNLTLTLTSDHPLMGLSSPDSPEHRNGMVPSIQRRNELDWYSEVLNSTLNHSKNDSRNCNELGEDSWFPSDVSSVGMLPDFRDPPSPNADDDLTPCSTPGEDRPLHQKDPSNGSLALVPESGRVFKDGRRKIVPISVPDLNESCSPCSSPGEDQSLYQASVDPFSGCASLRPAAQPQTESNISTKKKILAIIPDSPTGTECSIDSRGMDDNFGNDDVSLASVKSEDVYVNMVKRCTNGIGGFSTGVTTRDAADGDVTDSDTESSRRDSQTRSDASEAIPEYSANEERRDSRDWVKVTLPTGGHRSIDMRVIEPYKRVLSHGGYTRSPSEASEDSGVSAGAAIIVFSACYLPDSTRVDYNYVMDNLFLYVLWTLERLVTDDYVLVYLHGSASRCRMPTFHWMRKCYQLIDRRLRKSLKHLYLVHPTFWLKSIVWMSRPFISTKFSQKLSYVNSIDELIERVPVETAAIPEKVRQYDESRT